VRHHAWEKAFSETVDPEIVAGILTRMGPGLPA
jgi:hypothetical protein